LPCTFMANPHYKDIPQECPAFTRQSVLDNTYPIALHIIKNVSLAIHNNTFLIIEGNRCYSHPAELNCLQTVLVPTEFDYSPNGTRDLQLTNSVSLTCDLPCIPTEYSVYCNEIEYLNSFSFFYPLSIDTEFSIFRIGGFSAIEKIEFNQYTTVISLEYKQNSYEYNDPFYLELGYLDNVTNFINFKFCPYPYCMLNSTHIYPTSFFEIYEISDKNYGCLAVDFFSGCNSAKRSITPVLNITKVNDQTVFTGFSVGYYNNQVYFSSMAINVTQDDEIGNMPADQSQSSLFWISLSLVLFLYIIILMYIAYKVMLRCQNGFKLL